MRPLSATLFGKRVPIPTEIDLSALGTTLSFHNSGGGRVIISGSETQNTPKIIQKNGQNLVFNKAMLAETQWFPGQTFSIELIEKNQLLLVPIDGRDHIDFHSPIDGPDGLPMPPHFLLQAFTSTPEVLHGLSNGARAAEFVAEKAAAFNKPLSKNDTFLDFGCGSGRVLRAMHRLTGAEVIGTDLHKLAIEWCRKHYPFASFLDGVLSPPLPLENDSVDVMLALSVLTHLDRESCDRWLREWKRILKPGSIAVITFHGEGLMDARIPKETEARRLIDEKLRDNDGVAFVDNDAWEGFFPEEYQTTYHTNAHVRNVWGDIMEVCEILPSGSFVNKQDVAILRA